MNRYCLFIMNICFLLLITGCGSSSKHDNKNKAQKEVPPVIYSITVTGTPAALGATVTAVVNASSPKGLPLTYSWVVSSGWSIASGNGTDTVSITAPSVAGNGGTVTVLVTDTNSLSVHAQAALVTEGGSAPVISGFSIFPKPVVTSAQLTCSASDIDGDPLSYTWYIGGVQVATGNPAIWNSPGIPGIYNAAVVVSDAIYNTTATTTINVSSTSPWPSLGRDAGNSGLSAEDTTTISNTVQWSYFINGTASPPAIGADGTIYIGSYNNNLYALNPNGTLKWTFPTGSYIWSSPAIGTDGTVYVGSNDNNFYAINSNGSQKWSYAMGNFVGSPTIGADGTIYVNSAGLYALNPNGSLKWSIGNSASAPALGSDGTIYFGSGNSLVALNPDSSQKWSYAMSNSVGSPAIGSDGTIYFGADDGYLYALDPTGSFKWSYPVATYQFPPSIGADGTVYTGSSDYNLYAINPNGTLKWKYLTGKEIYYSPAISAEGTLYFTSVDGNIYALYPDSSLKWKYPSASFIVGGPAIAADGTIYFGDYYDNLYALH